MTAEQAVNEITSEVKYYIGVYPQSTASDLVKRFRNGSITLNKLEEFLNNFGYVKREGEWIKTKTQNQVLKHG